MYILCAVRRQFACNNVYMSFNAYMHTECMYIYIYTHLDMHACMHTCMRTYAYIQHTENLLRGSVCVGVRQCPVCLCMYVYIRAFVCVGVRQCPVCMYVCMYIYDHLFVWGSGSALYVCIYACMHVCIHVCVCVCVHTSIYLCGSEGESCMCMHVCIHVCMYVCTYIHAHTQKFTHAYIHA